MSEIFTYHTDSQQTVCSIYLSLLRFSSIAIELKVDGQRALSSVATQMTFKMVYTCMLGMCKAAKRGNEIERWCFIFGEAFQLSQSETSSPHRGNVDGRESIRLTTEAMQILIYYLKTKRILLDSLILNSDSCFGNIHELDNSFICKKKKKKKKKKYIYSNF